MGPAHKHLAGIDTIVHPVDVERAMPVKTHKQHEKVEFKRLHLTELSYLRKSEMSSLYDKSSILLNLSDANVISLSISEFV